MDHASRGETALKAGNPQEAVTHYTTAIFQSPSAPAYYIKRSIAYQRTSKFEDALQDAEMGITLAQKRGRRELIASGQLRRAVALLQLGRYGDAGFVFDIAKKLDEKEKSIDMYKSQLKAKLAKLDEDDPAREVTVKDMPDAQAIPEPSPKPTTSASDTATNGTSHDQSSANAAPTQTPQSKIRHEWYQSSDNVYLTLLAKGVPKDEAQVEIQPTSVSISFPLVTKSTYDFSLDPLFGKVDPAGSSHRVLSTKIEVILKKVDPGHKWGSLEGSSDESAAEGDKAATGANSGPAYPTSSRSGPKNWDKIVNSYTKPAEKRDKHKEEPDSEPEAIQADDAEAQTKPTKEKKAKENKKQDEADEDIYIDDYDDEGDPANAFFKKLYSGADPDTRRAMMKSYQESGGTALSTDWASVGSKRVEISPPDGMEAKKWET